MRIVVCIKQVPDTTEVRLDPVTNTLIRDGVPSIINPDDKAGIEVALRIKEKTNGHVTVVCMGPPQADTALREALAMGCNEAVLVTDRAFGGADTWATSCTLAASLKKIAFDIVITGRQAIDGDTAQVGPQLAEHLGLPQVSYVEDIEVEGDLLVVKRAFEDRCHIIEVKAPCLLTMLSQYTVPRYMTMAGIMKAYQTTVINWTLKDLEGIIDISNIGLKGSPTKVIRSFTKSAKPKGNIHDDLSSDEAASLIVEKLRENHFA